MTMAVFCGNLPQSFHQKIATHDLEIDLLPTPTIAPLLDLFPALQSLPAFLSRHKKMAQTYLTKNQEYWRWLDADVRKQMVTHDVKKHASELMHST